MQGALDASRAGPGLEGSETTKRAGKRHSGGPWGAHHPETARGPGLEARLTAMRKALEPPRPRLRKPLRPSASSPSPGKQHRPRVRQEAALGTRGW